MSAEAKGMAYVASSMLNTPSYMRSMASSVSNYRNSSSASPTRPSDESLLRDSWSDEWSNAGSSMSGDIPIDFDRDSLGGFNGIRLSTESLF